MPNLDSYPTLSYYNPQNKKMIAGTFPGDHQKGTYCIFPHPEPESENPIFITHMKHEEVQKHSSIVTFEQNSVKSKNSVRTVHS